MSPQQWDAWNQWSRTVAAARWKLRRAPKSTHEPATPSLPTTAPGAVARASTPALARRARK